MLSILAAALLRGPLASNRSRTSGHTHGLHFTAQKPWSQVFSPANLATAQALRNSARQGEVMGALLLKTLLFFFGKGKAKAAPMAKKLSPLAPPGAAALEG